METLSNILRKYTTPSQDSYYQIVGELREAFFSRNLKPEDQIAAVADPRIFNLPDSELEAITRSYGLARSRSADRADMILNILNAKDQLNEILTPYRKKYTGSEVVELFFVPTWDRTTNVGDWLSPSEPTFGKSLFEVLQLEQVLPVEDRLVLDQPAMYQALPTEGAGSVDVPTPSASASSKVDALNIFQELQKEDAQIPFRFRNLTYDQLVNFYRVSLGQVDEYPTRLLLVKNNKPPTEQVKKRQVFAPNPIFKLSQSGIPVSYLPITLTYREAEIVEQYTRETQVGLKDRPVLEQSGVFDQDGIENLLQNALAEGYMPIRTQNWWIPNNLYREMYNLARYPPVIVINMRKKPLWSWEEYERIRRTDIGLISRILSLQGHRWSAINLLDNEAKRFWFTRNEIPKETKWDLVQDRFLEYQWIRDAYSDDLLPVFERMISNYLGLGFEELDIGVAYANYNEQDPGIKYLDQFATVEKAERAAQKLEIVPSAELEIRTGIMAQFGMYRPYLMRPKGFELPFKLDNTPSSQEALNWMAQISDMELLEIWGVQPYYRDRQEFLFKLYEILRSPNFSFILGDNCTNTTTAVDLEEVTDPDVILLGYGIQSGSMCFTVNELELILKGYPDSVELPLFDRPNSGDVYPPEKIPDLQGLLRSIDQPDVASDLSKYVSFWDYLPQDIIQKLAPEDHAELTQWFQKLFDTGMYMRRWDGEGSYPISSRQTLIDLDPFPNVTVSINEMQDLEEKMKNNLKRLLPRLTLGIEPREKLKIKELLRDIRDGHVCIRVASNYIIKSADMYLKILGAPVEEFNPEHLDFIS